MSYSKNYTITTLSKSLEEHTSYWAYVGRAATPIIPTGRIRANGSRATYTGSGSMWGGTPYTAIAGDPPSSTFPFGRVCYNGDWVPGKIGNYSLRFDGSNDYITAGTVSDFAWMNGKGNTSAFKWSLSCWIKLNTKPSDTNDMQVIFSTNNSTAGAGVTIAVDDSGSPGTQALSFTIYNSSNQAKLTMVRNYSMSNDTCWHHLVVTYDEAATAADPGNGNMYLDNVQKLGVGGKNSPAGTLDTDSAQKLTIGDHTGGSGGKKWNGLIDELAIWDVVLSREAISELFNGSGGCDSLGRPATSVSASNLVSYWNFEDGPGSSTLKNYPGAISGAVSGTLVGLAAGSTCPFPIKKPW